MSNTKTSKITLEAMHSEMDLSEYRAEIDEIDRALHNLLISRMDVMRRVAQVKDHYLQRGSHIRAERGVEVMRNAYNNLKDFYPKESIAMLYRALISASELVERPFIMASADTICYWLAREFYGAHVQHIQCENSDEVFKSLDDYKCDVVFMPFPDCKYQDKWWLSVINTEYKVYAIAPFYGTSDVHPALVIGRVALFPSANTGSDITLVAVSHKQKVSFQYQYKIIDESPEFQLLMVEGYIKPESFVEKEGVYLVGLYGAPIV